MATVPGGLLVQQSIQARVLGHACEQLWAALRPCAGFRAPSHRQCSCLLDVRHAYGFFPIRICLQLTRKPCHISSLSSGSAVPCARVLSCQGPEGSLPSDLDFQWPQDSVYAGLHARSGLGHSGGATTILGRQPLRHIL
eukprot:scaffold4815_cov363-Prasinococcus_capsulatus_cf.AAC.5